MSTKVMQNRNKSKVSIVSKFSFPWIYIQSLLEKEENYFVKHTLIESFVSTSTSTSTSKKSNENYIEQDLGYLKKFINKFGFEKYFDLSLPGFSEGCVVSKDKKKYNKKKTLSSQEIIDQNRILYQDSDLDKFTVTNNIDCQIDFKVNFKYKISFYMYILFWGVTILKRLKNERPVNHIVVLDACLSLNRIISSKHITKEEFLSGFLFIEERFNKIMNENFYKLLFQNPKYLINSSFQSVQSEIKLYPEQYDMLNILKDHIDTKIPLLLLNKNPTGQGKTFSAAVIARLFSTQNYNNKTLLFSCSNELVCNQLASDCMIADQVHLWLGRSAFVSDADKKITKKTIIRPYKSCFPSTWKTIYKNKNDDEKKLGDLSKQWYYYLRATKKQPDIIICDLDTTLELLKIQSELENPFVAFLDEWVTTKDDAITMAKICYHLPMYSIFLSSVLPEFTYMKTIVDHFLSCHKTTFEASCKRIASTNINIPIAIFGKDGKLRFPHHIVEKKDDLEKLIDAMHNNPRTRRSYPSSYVYEWCHELEQLQVLPQELHFKSMFPTIGSINQNDICEFVILILKYLLNNFNEHTLEKFKRYKPHKINPISHENIFTTQTHQFDPSGKTLIIFNETDKDINSLTIDLFKDKPKLSVLLKELDLKKKQIEKQLQCQKKTKPGGKDKNNKKEFDKKYSDSLIEQNKEDLENLQLNIPSKYILNHKDHYLRFHTTGEVGELPKSISVKDNINLPKEYFDTFGEDEIYQILSTIGVYDTKTRGKYENELIMKVYNSFLFFCCSKEIIYGSNLASLCNIYLMGVVADTLTTPEIYQLLGRIGRTGLSFHSNLFIDDDKTLFRILNFDESFEKETYVESEFEKLIINLKN